MCLVTSRITAVFGAVLFLASPQCALASDDFGSWHALAVTLLDSERWTLSAVAPAPLSR